jgi:hypothetical protein
MQEQRSREAKKAEETLAPTQVAQLSMAAAGDLVARVRPRGGGGGTDLGRRRARSGGIRGRGVHRGACGVARAGGADGIWAGGGGG